MAKDDVLIKNGIRYSDQLFKSILKQIEPAVYDSETFEEFLVKTAPYTIENPMITLGADEHAINTVLLSVASNIYSYEANRKLTEQTIQDTTSQLVTNVGEDVKQTIRDTMQKGFKENKLRQDIMKDLTNNVSAINNKRAKVIYRTEIKRAQTISNYISAKERGANAFYCNCNKPCPICKKQYNGGGKGSKIYSMVTDKDKLPPVHPNCRCVAVFIKDDNFPEFDEDVPSTNTKNSNNVEIETPMDEDIKLSKEYIKDLEDELEGLTDKYEIMDLKEEIKMAKEDLKAFENERAEYLKSNSSSVEKIRPEKVKFTNDTNIERKPSEIKKAYGYTENVIPKSVRKNLNEFTKGSKNKSYETMQYYTDSGKISDLNEGKTHHVGNTAKVNKWLDTMKRHGENVHMVHNHPSWRRHTFLSEDDIRIFVERGYKSMSATGKNSRCTIGLLETTDVNSPKFGKAISDMRNLINDVARGNHKYEMIESKTYGLELTDEGHESLARDLGKIAEEGGFYYRLEDLDLSETSNKIPKSNMKDERTEFEKINDRIYEVGDKLSIETDPKKRDKLQKEYNDLIRLI